MVSMNEIEHDSQLLKGVLTMVLLHLIGERESYGYDLVEQVHAIGLAEVPDGSIYPALNRLEREGHITSYLVRSRAGPARKYYRLTESGRRSLADRQRAWNRLTRITSQLFTAELSTFGGEGSR